MTPGDPAWLEANDRYLAESLAWLRARLRQRAPAQPVVPVPMTPAPRSAPDARRQWYTLGGRQTDAQPSPPPVVTATLALPDSSQDDVTAATRRAEAAQITPPPALLMLAERLGLTEFERDTLLLAAAPELEPGIAELFGGAGGARTPPSFALALHALDGPSWDALSPSRPLRYARLVEIGQPAAPLTTAPLLADERIVHYLKGLNALDERLGGLLTPLPDEPPPLAPSQRAVAEAILQQLQAAGAAARVPLVALVGADAGSQRDTAHHVARVLGRQLHRLAIDALPATTAELEPLLRLWQRERLLLPIALFIDAHELASAPAEQQRAFHTLVTRDIGPAFLGLREPPGRGAGDALAFDVAKPTAREQQVAWLETIRGGGGGEAEGDDPAAAEAARLAGQFDLNLAEIRHVATLASVAAPGGAAGAADRWSACRRLAQPKLDMLAQRIEPKATWADLVLADEAMQLLRQIAAQARDRFKVYEDWGYAARMTRGLGISALFAGESGTGKTMAAEVIANELQLGLYRIDLSAIVSKYIGETEKNLSRLFDAAEQGGAILLFDEADALFGKRSEVKDSHDRYANIEINYLLQRMELFSGLAILATNMKSALDSAFMRRLRFIVNFPYPGNSEREAMWRRALPPARTGEGVDYARLARFGLSGGNIHSVALNAAFLAAAKDAPISQGLLLSAVRTELRKLDKPVNEAEFR